jgi:hypothetical protein
MTSAFFFGLLTQRSFLAEWQSPVPLDVVFDSPHVNWSYSSFTSTSHPVLGEKSLVEASKELDIIHFDRLSVDATFGSTSWNPKKDKQLTVGFEKRDLAYQSPFIKVRFPYLLSLSSLSSTNALTNALFSQFFTNRGMIYRSFKYKHLQKSIKRLGLQPSTAFACISQYLFQPKPPALNLISDYTSVLALPSVFSVGIHVRTGDVFMKEPDKDKINTGTSFLPTFSFPSAPTHALLPSPSPLPSPPPPQSSVTPSSSAALENSAKPTPSPPKRSSSTSSPTLHLSKPMLKGYTATSSSPLT